MHRTGQSWLTPFSLSLLIRSRFTHVSIPPDLLFWLVSERFTKSVANLSGGCTNNRLEATIISGTMAKTRADAWHKSKTWTTRLSTSGVSSPETLGSRLLQYSSSEEVAGCGKFPLQMTEMFPLSDGSLHLCVK